MSTNQASIDAQEWTWINAPATEKTIPARAITLKVPAVKLHEISIKNLDSAAEKKTVPDVAERGET